MTILEERLPYLDKLTLGSGSHRAPNNGLVEACVMEAVSYVAGEPWSDRPKCASRVLTSFLIRLNDRLDDGDRQLLKPYIVRLVGTNTGPEDEETRRYMLLDWVAHEALPGLLRKADLTDLAEELEKLVAVTDPASAKAARDTFRSIRDLTWEKRQAWRAEIRKRVEDELAKRGVAAAAADAAAVAVAAAAAVADAAAAAVAVAVADADAAAVAVADADAAAAADAAAVAVAAAAAVADAVAAAVADADADAAARWGTVYDAVYKAVKPIYVAKFGEINRGLLASALQLTDRLIEVGKA
jgi:hypothetical protein